MTVTDFLYDPTTKDDYAVDGDLPVGDATLQSQEVILMAAAGEIKQWPDLGVGLFCHLDDEGPDDLMRDIRQQLVKDQMTVNDISISATGELIVDANY